MEAGSTTRTGKQALDIGEIFGLSIGAGANRPYAPEVLNE